MKGSFTRLDFLQQAISGISATTYKLSGTKLLTGIIKLLTESIKKNVAPSVFYPLFPLQVLAWAHSLKMIPSFVFQVVEVVDASRCEESGGEPIAGLENQATLKVFNKIDLCSGGWKEKQLDGNDDGGVFISLKTGEGS